MTTTCEKCGIEIQHGDFPFCPHGRGAGYRGHDEIPGGLWIENLGPTPVKVYSQSEIDRLAKANGRERFVRHMPAEPGSDYSPHTTNWGRMTDPQTMENARILVSRMGAKASDPPVVCETLTFAVETR